MQRSLHFCIYMLGLCVFGVFACCVVAACAQAGAGYCSGNASFVSVASSDVSLAHVLVVTRHGDRVPVNALAIPGDSVAWNCSLDMQSSDNKQGLLASPSRVLQKKYIQGKEEKEKKKRSHKT